MTADTTWPDDVLPPRSVMPEVASASESTDRQLTAIEDLVDSGADYWHIILDQIPVASPAQKLAWRKMAAQLGGRLGTCSVPVFPPGQGDFAATVRDAVAEDATALIIRVTDASVMLPGMLWSVVDADGNDRLYKLIEVEILSTVGATIDYSCEIWPPTRSAIAPAEPANFLAPRCICRLEDDQDVFSAADDYAGRTLAKISWVEYR